MRASSDVGEPPNGGSTPGSGHGCRLIPTRSLGLLMQPTSLDGRTALVTGASRGIGAAIARALDRAGARVALVARGRAALDAVASQLRNEPVVLAADLADPALPARLVAETFDRLGRIDVLVNNAAVAARAPTVELDAALVDRLYAVNVRAPLLLIAALIPSMIERGSGVIISISSGSAVVGTPGEPRTPPPKARSTRRPGRSRSSSARMGSG